MLYEQLFLCNSSHMKKVFYLLFYIFLFILIWIEESFGNTFSFRTYDDRAFCETDRLDGSFVLCTKEQTSGTGLTIAAVYGPQLLETTNERICVEKGKQVEAILCSEQAAALDMTPIWVIRYCSRFWNITINGFCNGIGYCSRFWNITIIRRCSSFWIISFG